VRRRADAGFDDAAAKGVAAAITGVVAAAAGVAVAIA
jgi:hypothetical protein